MGRAGDDALGAVGLQRAGGVAERAGGVDHVVDDDAVLALDVADDVHDLAHVGALAALVDDGERGVEALGVGARALDAAGVGRDEARRAVEVLAQVVLEEHRHREEVVEGDVEEALDLAGVEVDAQHAVDAGGDHADRRTSLEVMGVRGATLRSCRA